MTATAPKPTVHLHMTIEISCENEDLDTGISVDKWNAMDNSERQAAIRDIWIDEASSYDNGGVSVITDEAEEA